MGKRRVLTSAQYIRKVDSIGVSRVATRDRAFARISTRVPFAESGCFSLQAARSSSRADTCSVCEGVMLGEDMVTVENGQKDVSFEVVVTNRHQWGLMSELKDV